MWVGGFHGWGGGRVFDRLPDVGDYAILARLKETLRVDGETSTH